MATKIKKKVTQAKKASESKVKPEFKELKRVEDIKIPNVAPKKPVSMPYLFTIKNKTVEYIKNFSLNNTEQALGVGSSYDSRVAVTNLHSNMTYLRFLESMRSLQPTIGLIRIESYHDYDRYMKMQLNQSVLFSDDDPDGKSISFPAPMYMKLNQIITWAVEADVNFEFLDGWDLKFNLMPEASITVFLWPKSAWVRNGERKEYRRPSTYIEMTKRFEEAQKEKDGWQK